MPESDAFEIDELLTHSRWVRRLAASLLFDQGRVDDVVQQTWLIAMKQRPREPEHTRAWLGGIIRNLVRREARSNRRRSRHEAEAPVPDDLPSTDDLVTRADIQQKVVHAVLRLAEPYRTTVLLRYFEDLSAEDIARRLDIPGSTVRSRLKRALEQLRRRLDGEFGGARSSWSLSLIPLALSSGAFGEMAFAHAAAQAAAQATAQTTGHAAAQATGQAGAQAGGSAVGPLAGTGLKGTLVMTAKAKVLVGAIVVIGAFGLLWSTVQALDAGDAETGPPSPVAAVPADPPASPTALSNALPGALEAPVESLGVGGQAVPAVAGNGLAGEVAVLSGRIEDAQGEPLAEAEVRFSVHDGDVRGLLGVNQHVAGLPLLQNIRVPRVLSDAEGRFTLDIDVSRWDEDDRDGTLLVVLHDAHATRIHANGQVAVGANDLGTLRLARGAGVVGRVVDRNGGALSDVEVSLVSEQPTVSGDTRSGVFLHPDRLARSRRTVVRTATDEEGRFALAGLAGGRVDLLVARPDHRSTALVDVAVVPGESTDLGTLTLEAGPRLSGIVQDAKGEPVADAEVYARSHDFPKWPDDDEVAMVAAKWEAHVRTDSLGRFLIGDLQPGPYSVHARAKGTAFTHVAAVAPSDPPLVITLLPPGEIVLTVRDGETGDVVEGAQLWTSLPDAFELRPIRDDTSHLSAAYHDLEAGTHLITGAGREGTKLQVRARGYAQAVAVTPPVPSAGRITFELLLEPAQSFGGIVIDEAGRPIVHASVQMAAESGAALGTGTIGVRSDDSGRFVFTNVVPGRWQLWVNAPGRHTASNHHLVLPKGKVEDYVIRLLPKAVVEGVVKGADGEILPGATVMALPRRSAVEEGGDRWEGLPVSLSSWDSDSSRPSARKTPANEQGFYRFNDLMPDEFVLLATSDPVAVEATFRASGARRSAFPRQAQEIHLDGGAHVTRDLVLAEGALVSGTVTDAGRAVSGAIIRLATTPTGDEPWTLVAETTSDEMGGFRVRGLFSGPALLLVNAAQGFVRIVRVELVDDDVVVADIDLHGHTLAFEVVDASSREPLPAARVRLVRTPEIGQSWASFPDWDLTTMKRIREEVRFDFDVYGETDGLGQGELVSVLPGRYWLVGRASGFLADSARFGVEAHTIPERVTVALERAAVLEGTARTRSGRPVEDVIVELHRLGEEGLEGRGYTEDGQWVIDPVRPGTYEIRIVAWTEQRTFLASQPVTLARGERVTVDFTLEER